MRLAVGLGMTTSMARVLGVLGVVLSACAAESDLPSSSDAARPRADRGMDDGGADSEPELSLLPTLFRVRNAGIGARARLLPCTEPAFTYFVRTADSPQHLDVCPSAPACDSLQSGGRVDTPCAPPSCLGSPLVLQPGAVDEVAWNGELTVGNQRGCVDHPRAALGDAMETKICWGSPSGSLRDVVDYQCVDVSFNYGDPVVNVELPARIDDHAPEVLPTTFRVVNRSGRVLASQGDCGGNPLPVTVEEPGQQPIPGLQCAPVCDPLQPSRVYEKEQCSFPDCVGQAATLNDGEHYESTWNGKLSRGTSRKCYEPVYLSSGMPLQAAVCWGEGAPPANPGPALVSCRTITFAYGDPNVTIELE